MSRNAGAVLAVAGVIAIAAATLHPQPRAAAAAAETPLACLVCGDHGGVDVVLNLILFLPFGLGLGLAGWPWRRAAAAAALLSLTVEALQLFVIPGRDASLGDLVNNTLGGGLGAALAPRLSALALPTPRSARRLLATGAAVWLGLLGLSAWLQSPGTSGGMLGSGWAHHLAKPGPFDGEVRSATLDGVAMPPLGTPPDASGIRRRLKLGEITVAVDAVSGPRTSEGGWIYVITAGRRPQLVVAQRARRAVITVPARALRLRLRPPTLSLSEGFPPDSGMPVTIEGGRTGNRVRVASSYAGERRTGDRRTMELALSPAHGWGLVAPFNFPLGPGLRLVTAACIAGLVLPLGYWGASAGRPGWALLVLGLALAGGLAAVPAFAGYEPVHWSEWLAAGLAAAAGWALHRLAAYLQLRCGSPSTGVSS